MKVHNWRPLLHELAIAAVAIGAAGATAATVKQDLFGIFYVVFIHVGIVCRQLIARYRRRNPGWVRRDLGDHGWNRWKTWSLERRSLKNELLVIWYASTATVSAIIALAFLGFANFSNVRQATACIVLGFVCAIFSQLGRTEIRRGEIEVAEVRNSRGKVLTLKAMHNAPSPQFVLYLRPFLVSGHLFSTNPYHVPVIAHSDYHFHRQFIEFEQWVSEAVACIGPLIALTSSDGCVSVPVVGKSWEDDVKRLANRAALIVVVPLTRPGTLFEISLLASLGHFEKTAFLMPPHVAIDFFPVKLDLPKPNFDIAAQWDDSRTVLENRLSISIPPYNESGAVIWPSLSGKPRAVMPINLANEDIFVKQIRQMVPSIFE